MLPETVSPSAFGQYLRAFRQSFLSGVRSQFAKGDREKVGLADFFRTCQLVGTISGSYGISYGLIPAAGSLEVRSVSFPIYEILTSAQPVEYPDEVFRLYVNSQSTTAIHNSTFDPHAPIMIDNAALFLERCRVYVDATPITMRGANSELVVAESRFGREDSAGWVPYAYFSGSNDATRWTSAVGNADAATAVMRAKVEMLLDDQAKRPFQNLARDSVLVLGAFDEAGSMRMSAIMSALSDIGYKPFRADDIEDIPRQDIRSKVLALASTCRFVVLDDSSPAGQLTEFPIVDQSKTPCAALRLRGSHSSAMTRGGKFASIKEFDYNQDEIQMVVESAAQWAEEEIAELERINNEAYRSWRSKPTSNPPTKYGLAPFVRQSAL